MFELQDIYISKKFYEVGEARLESREIKTRCIERSNLRLPTTIAIKKIVIQ